jgi:hypothetical protein
MAVSKVVVVDGNNLIVRIDRGVAGRGITDVAAVEIDNSLYLVFSFTDGTTETVGPVGTIQYIGQAPIVVAGSTISLSTVPVNLGGTGATTAANARTNLNAANQDTTITAGTGLSGGGSLAANRTLSIANTAVTAAAYGSASKTLTATVNAQGQLTALADTNIAIANTQISGLGTMSTQNATSVAITGGSITGITDLAVADGGTGASDASGARTNLGAAASAITISAGTGLSGGGDLSANRTLSIANTAVTAAAYGSASNTLTATVNAQGQLTALAATPIAIANTQVSGLGTASVLNAGVALGVATLDAGGTVPLSQIPASIQGGVSYQGSWNAATNTPTLTSSVGSKGYYYVVSVAGSTNLNGITDWLPGDWAIFNGSVWEQIDNTDTVASVNGYVGAVVLTAADVGAPPTTRTISAGTGLTGGGDLSANRTIAIDSTVVTLTGTQTLTNKTLTSAIANEILDVNGNEILSLLPVASATDYVTVKNGIGVGVPLHIQADGSSANIGMHLQPKGTGLITISDGTDFNKGIRFRSSGSAAGAVTLIDAVSSAGHVITLPNATTTLVGRDTTDTLTNKTINLASNTLQATSAEIAAAVTDETGTGALVFANSPTFVTPVLGTPASGTVTNLTGTASININGTVGATTASTGAFTSVTASTAIGTASGGTGLGGATPFTANGVVYASSTSALATGSALTFDGALLTLGTSSGFPISGSKFQIGNDANAPLRLAISNQNAGASALVGIAFEPAGGGWKIDVPADTAGFVPPMYFKAGASTNVTFGYGGAVGIGYSSLNSVGSGGLAVAGNVGVGTASPTTKLHIANAGATYLRANNTTSTVDLYVGAQTNDATIAVISNHPLTFATNSIERMRLDTAGRLSLLTANGQMGFASGNTAGGVKIQAFNAAGNADGYLAFEGFTKEYGRFDSAGNLGLGVTPSAWGSPLGSAFLEAKNGMHFGSIGTAVSIGYIGVNSFYNGTNWIYKNSTYSNRYELNSGNTGAHAWFLSTSAQVAGTDPVFSQAMTLNASGQRMLGITSPYGIDTVSKTVDNGTAVATNISAFGGSISVIHNQDDVGTGNKNGLFFSHAGAPGLLSGIASTKLSGTWQTTLDFYVNNITGVDTGDIQLAARINSAGNFLVGTATAGYASAGRGLVEINGSSALLALKTGDVNRGYLYTQGTDMIAWAETGNFSLGTAASAFINFQTSNTERARISSDGTFRVKGAGTAGSTDAFQVAGTAPADAARLTSGGDFLVGSTTNGSGAWRAYVLSTDIQGAAYFETPVASGNTISKFVRSASDGTAIAFSRGGADVGSVSITTTATAYNTSSDERLKDNIQDAASASALIDSLQVRQFDWKLNSSHQRYGFVAQELVAVAPEAVHQPADPEEMMAVDYSKLVPMLVKEIQDLRARVASLESSTLQ